MPFERGRYVPRRRQEDEEDDSSDNPLGVDPLDPYVEEGAVIGVPPGYEASVDVSSYPFGGPGRVNRRPIYQDGDELIPANYGPERIGQLQQQLAEIGLLPENARIRFKVWDETSQEAFYRLLAYANQNGLHWTTALNKLQTENEGGFMVDENGKLVPVGGAGSEPLPTSTTPAEELRPVFRQTVIDVLGQGWDEDQIDAMVQAYQAQEIERQKAAYAAEGTTNNVEQMPSPEAFIMAQAEESDPDRAAAERGLDYTGLFEEVLGGWENAGLGTL